MSWAKSASPSARIHSACVASTCSRAMRLTRQPSSVRRTRVARPSLGSGISLLSEFRPDAVDLCLVNEKDQVQHAQISGSEIRDRCLDQITPDYVARTIEYQHVYVRPSALELS